MPHNNENEKKKPKKLQPSWGMAPKVSELKADALGAKTSGDAHRASIDNWLSKLKGEDPVAAANGAGKSKFVSKLIRKQAEWRYTGLSEPFLSNGSDLFDVNPVTFEDKKAAEQNGLVINNQFSTVIKKVKLVDALSRVLVNEGTGILKVGWEYKEEAVTIEVPNYEYVVAIDPQFIEQLVKLKHMKEMEPGMYSSVDDALRKSLEYSEEVGRPFEAILNGVREEKSVKVIRNHPTVEVLNYNNVTVDPSAGDDVNKAGFIIYNFESSLSELRKTGKYENLDSVIVGSSSVYDDPDFDPNANDTSFTFEQESRQKIVVTEYWGYWDIQGNGHTTPIMATYVGDTMIQLDENPFSDGEFPFVFISYLPVKDSLYGEPDGELLADNQAIASAVTRGMLDMMAKSAAGQQGYREGSLTPANRQRFRTGLDYEFAFNSDPTKSFHTHTYPDIPQSAALILNQQHSEAESLSGVKAFNNGITGNSLGDTASNGKSALDAAAKREMGILRRITEGWLQVARKIISMNADFLSEEEVVRITNDKFVVVRKDDLGGNFDLRLSVSTPEADEAKAEQLAFLLQTTGQTMGSGFSQIILSDIAKLRKMPDLARRIAEYQPQPDPLAQEKAQLEIALLKAQIANENQLAVKSNASAQLDIARVNTEGAKAGNLLSDTDLKDLDFLETESGTKQARTLEVNGEQAKANEKIKQQELNSKATDVKTTNGMRPT
jgi:hypothetical protein